MLTGLLPSGTGDLVIFIALIGLGMELPPRRRSWANSQALTYASIGI
jgi:hypothetical protein